MLLARWFCQTMRVAESPVRTDRPMPRLTTAGPFGYSRKPCLPHPGYDLCWDSRPSELALDYHPTTFGALPDTARSSNHGFT